MTSSGTRFDKPQKTNIQITRKSNTIHSFKTDLLEKCANPLEYQNWARIKRVPTFPQRVQISGEDFGVLYKRITNMKIKNIVALVLHKGIDEEFSWMSQILNHLKNLKSLKISLYSLQKISESKLSDLIKRLRNLKYLKKIDLQFSSCQTRTNKGVVQLSQVLKKLRCLQDITLNIADCWNINARGIKIITKIFTRLMIVKTLSLNFQNKYSIVSRDLNQSLTHLTQHLSRINSLETIQLNFSECEGFNNNNNLSDLIESFKIMKNLKDLTFHFVSCREMSSSILSSFSEKLQLLENLEHLHLNFANCQELMDSGLLFLGVSFYNFSMKRLLRILILNFSMNGEITDFGFKHLTLNLGQLENLESIFFNFSWYFLINKMFNFLSTKLSDESLNHLSRAVQNLTKLTKIDLNFAQNSNITNQGLINITKGVQHILSLKKLRIDFGRCPNINGRGLHWIVETLKILNSLEDLKINLLTPNEGDNHDDNNSNDGNNGRFVGVNEEEIINFCRILEGMSSLKSLFLSLFAPNITDNGVQAIIKALEKNKKTLRGLFLNLSLPKNKISEKVLQDYQCTMHSIPYLDRDSDASLLENEDFLL